METLVTRNYFWNTKEQRRDHAVCKTKHTNTQKNIRTSSAFQQKRHDDGPATCSNDMKAATSIAMAISSATTSTLKRTFHLVPFGAKFDPATSFPGRPWIACDGRVQPTGATAGTGTVSSGLELSHWNGNGTPDKYYADTSTEMALLLPPDIMTDAVVVNNHLDTDGLLSVFACLQPALAQQYKELLISAAEAGDFGEWTSNGGVVLDACVAQIGNNEDPAAAYDRALQALPDLLKAISTAGSTPTKTPYDELLQVGQSALAAAQRDYAHFQDGTAKAMAGPGQIVLIQEPFLESNDCSKPLSSLAIHKHLVEKGLLSTCNRILQYSEHSIAVSSPTTFTFRYSKPGYTWVHKLRDRRSIPDVGITVEELVKQLHKQTSGAWRKGHNPYNGLAALCQEEIAGHELSPMDVAAILFDLDAGAR